MTPPGDAPDEDGPQRADPVPGGPAVPLPDAQDGVPFLGPAPPLRTVKVLSVFGTRPEAIKMAPVIKALSAHERAVSRVCVTAQHRGLLDQVLAHFSIRPDHDLDVMTADQTSSQVAARVLSRLEPVLREERPDWVLVQGDTTTTLAAAMAASYAGVRVAHVEAGLRSFDTTQPFPEEFNRRLVSALADLHFAPTSVAEANLLREGVAPQRVVVTGNTGIDSLYATLAELDRQPDPRDSPWGPLPDARRIILATVHRHENLGAVFVGICHALAAVAARFLNEVYFVCPLHPRREVQATAHALLGRCPNIRLIEPLGYLHLVRLLRRSDVVITDSGGLQEEAPALGKPVLVLRNVTERPEGVTAGSARLAGTHPKGIVREITRVLQDRAAYAQMSRRSEPYGDGHAAQRIVCALLEEPVRAWVPSVLPRRPGAAQAYAGRGPGGVSS
jgi:UDP-N-acetylglucosamine 2-epimerase (non-hydrolysing)